MNNNETRQMAIFLIWLAHIVTILTAMTTDAASNSRGFFLISCAIFVIGAVGATTAVWKNSSPETGKKVKHLLEHMDESELHELRNRLLGKYNGEAESLSELLTERERQRQ